MFKGNKKFIYIFVGLFGLIILAQYLLPKPVDWTYHRYLSKDKAPFGCYAAYSLMDGVYSRKFRNNTQTFYNLKDKAKDSTSVLLINDNFNLNKSDIRSLFQMLENGTTVFMAANSFDGPLADTFHVKTHYDFSNFFVSIDSLVNKTGETITLAAKNKNGEKFVYTRAAAVSSFNNFDTTKFSILAYTRGKEPCLISAKVGKGKIFLMSVPDVFANVFVVKHKNRELAYTLLSMIKNRELIWDEYYKTFNVTNYSPVKFILENDALYSAYLLLFFTLILYTIFEGRRRQRPIPVTEPVKNITLEFVDVISHVYFNSKNHHDIASEKIKYFYETVRKKFNVSTAEINPTFINEITELSGIEEKLVKQLFSYCERIKNASEISEYDLIELNRQISNFNKNSLR